MEGNLTVAVHGGVRLSEAVAASSWQICKGQAASREMEAWNPRWEEETHSSSVHCFTVAGQLYKQSGEMTADMNVLEVEVRSSGACLRQ